MQDLGNIKIYIMRLVINMEEVDRTLMSLIFVESLLEDMMTVEV